MDKDFFKSSRSTANSQCVEVAFVGDDVFVRHSRIAPETEIRYTGAEWDAFIQGVKDGEFDRNK